MSGAGAGMIAHARVSRFMTALPDDVADERMACVAHLRGKAAEVRGMIGRRGLTAQDGDMLARRLDATADEIAAGLHA